VVTLFRTVDAANSSGWWTVLTSPLDLIQYTLASYRQTWYGGHGQLVPQQPGRHPAGHRHPDHGRRLRRLRLHLLRFRGRDVPFALVVVC
jgi:hypothetical protein